MGQAPWQEAMVLRRSTRAKYVRLKIHPPGRVEVVVPQGFDERELPPILARHNNWVEERLQQFASLHSEPLTPPSMITLPAIDERWQVEYLTGGDSRMACREQSGELLHVHTNSSEKSRELLKRWLARKGKQYMVPWLQQTSEEIGLPYSGVSIRCQRTRWGSCSASGRINLNYSLLFLQPDLVRYLLVHELCHTVHLNHSHNYWALVQSIEPHYKIMEKALKNAVHEVPVWLHTPFHA
jgi:predicted metal-dependent hydrolase